MKRIKKFLSNNKKLIQDYLFVISGTGIGRGLSLATTVILARLLGVEGFGIFSVFFTMTVVFWLIPTVIDPIYVRYSKAEEPSRKTEYIRVTTFMKLIVFFALVVLAYPLSWILGHLVFRKPELTHYLASGVIAGAFLSALSSLSCIYMAQERFHIYSLISMAAYPLIFLAVLAAALLKIKMTVPLAVFIYSGVCFFIGTLSVLFLYRKVRPLFSIKANLFFSMLHFGKWLMAGSFIDILLQRIDILFLARISNYTSLGIYSAAVRIAMIASLFSSAASVVFMPRGCASVKSIANLKKYFRESFLAVLGLSFCIGTLMILCPWIIHLFFGSEYLGAVLAARILLLESIFTIMYIPFSFIFYATANTRTLFNIGLTRLLIAAASLLIFVPLFGAAGAALAIAFSSLCTLVISVLVAYRVLRGVHANFSLKELPDLILLEEK